MDGEMELPHNSETSLNLQTIKKYKILTTRKDFYFASIVIYKVTVQK